MINNKAGFEIKEGKLSLFMKRRRNIERK